MTETTITMLDDDTVRFVLTRTTTTERTIVRGPNETPDAFQQRMQAYLDLLRALDYADRAAGPGSLPA